MDIGSKLKDVRQKFELSQEKVAEELQVSRQTISNWENGKTFPDIVSVIKLSELYNVSLDSLLKGDPIMIKHLEENTNVVKSNKKLILTIALNAALLVLLTFLNGAIVKNYVLMICSAAFATVGAALLFYQIIKRF